MSGIAAARLAVGARPATARVALRESTVASLLIAALCAGLVLIVTMLSSTA